MTEGVVPAGEASPPVGGGALIRAAGTGRLRLLGRSASGLTWMMRYIERAEAIARLIEAGQRMSLTRQGDAAGEWQAILSAAGQSDAYEATGRPYDAAGVADFLLRDDANPMPLRRMIETARFNARMVRTSLTREVWEAVNDFHLEMGTLLAHGVSPRDLPETMAVIRRHGALVRGAFTGSMLRNEIYDFARLGTFLERADGTARILDVKYHVLLPRAQDVGAELDTAQWEQLLRAVGVNRAFLMVHGGDYAAATVADFLILDERMPRSLAYCVDRMRNHLAHLAHNHAGETEADRVLAEMGARLERTDIGEILESGLHEFLTEFVSDLIRLSDATAASYRFFA
jgi:uncharacterized alpha-E superfamily protein